MPAAGAVLVVLAATAGCGDGRTPEEIAEAALVERAREVHARVVTLDTHVDIPLDFATFNVDPGRWGDQQVDLPKMREGGLDAAFFIVYVGQTERTPENYARARADAMTKFDAIHRMAEDMYPDEIEIAYRADDVERIAASGKLVAAIGIENGYAIGTDLERLAEYHELGARYMTLAHGGHNDIADSSTARGPAGPAEPEHGGVSEFGAQVIAEMNRLGIMVDVSHISKEAMLAATRLSAAPVIASHSSVAALHGHARNLDDEQLDALRASGGVVQTVALGAFLTESAQSLSAAYARLRSDFGDDPGAAAGGARRGARDRLPRPPRRAQRALPRRDGGGLRGPHRLRRRAHRHRSRRHQLRLRRRRRRHGLVRRQRDAERHHRAPPPRLHGGRDRAVVGRQPAAGLARGRARCGRARGLRRLSAARRRFPMARQAALDLPSALDPRQLDGWLAPVRAGRAVLFLDYDGTLTPIVDRPEEARLAESTRTVLAALAARCAVTIVTGRDVAVARRFVRLDSLGYAGCHGFDIVGPPGSGLRKEVAVDHLPVLDEAEALLRRELDGVRGALVERKRFSVSSHVRLVAPSERMRVESVVAAVAARLPTLRRKGGKAVHELRPDLAWDKGAAVAWLVREMGREPGAVVYIGDDLTDEDAFERLDGAGATIVVTAEDRPTSARLRLRDPAEVEVVLGRVLAALPARR